MMEAMVNAAIAGTEMTTRNLRSIGRSASQRNNETSAMMNTLAE
jgi:hypothetical protein